MLLESNVQRELEAFATVAARRELLDIEHAERKAYANVLRWIEEDKNEAARIEAEAAAAEEQERLRDPHQETKDLFSTYRKKLKQEGRR